MDGSIDTTRINERNESLLQPQTSRNQRLVTSIHAAKGQMAFSDSHSQSQRTHAHQHLRERQAVTGVTMGAPPLIRNTFLPTAFAVVSVLLRVEEVNPITSGTGNRPVPAGEIQVSTRRPETPRSSGGPRTTVVAPP